MSRRQLSRTPANFPRMKDRAAGRAIRKQRRQVLGALATIQQVYAGVVQTFAAFADAVAEALNQAGQFFAGVAEQLQRAGNQEDYALAGPVDGGPP